MLAALHAPFYLPGTRSPFPVCCPSPTSFLLLKSHSDEDVASTSLRWTGHLVSLRNVFTLWTFPQWKVSIFYELIHFILHLFNRYSQMSIYFAALGTFLALRYSCEQNIRKSRCSRSFHSSAWNCIFTKIQALCGQSRFLSCSLTHPQQQAQCVAYSLYQNSLGDDVKTNDPEIVVA